jgi:exodeoxyribonuclease VII large subunit
MTVTSITLSDLHKNIQQTIQNQFDEAYWITCEISELKSNQTGHCYLELIEKEKDTNSILAKSKATIWSMTYRMLKPYFETTSGYEFTSGIKVLIRAKVEFHSVYGFSLNIVDIDPTYTLGDFEKKRLEIINRLTQEGILNMNKEIQFPTIPKNIAIISSENAAGYGDFVNQLENNSYCFKFHHKLFQATMQGENVESSILAAFDKIYQHENVFDVVVIIRGGGSKSDLSWFDNYWIAYTVTQFPLPVLTGIGHEQDDTITDLVAHTRLKTPTAVAEFLISSFANFNETITEYESYIFNSFLQQIQDEKTEINQISSQIAISIKDVLAYEKQALSNIPIVLKNSISNFIKDKKNEINKKFEQKLKFTIEKQILNQKHKLTEFEQIVEHSDPQKMFKKGYSITLKNGKIVKSVSQLKTNDEIETLLSDGKILSKVKS